MTNKKLTHSFNGQLLSDSHNALAYSFDGYISCGLYYRDDTKLVTQMPLFK